MTKNYLGNKEISFKPKLGGIHMPFFANDKDEKPTKTHSKVVLIKYEWLILEFIGFRLFD